MYDLSGATGLLTICTCWRKRTSATHEKLKPSVVKVANRSFLVCTANMECSDSHKEPKGSQDLASDTPRSEGFLHSGSGLSQTSSHVDQIISAFEQITAQQPHPKPAAAEGGNQSSNAVRRFSNACMLSHPACASPFLSVCVKAVGTIDF